MKFRIATFVLGLTSAILCLLQKSAHTQVAWHSIDGCAEDIAGGNTYAWVIGCKPSATGPGNEIWNWNRGSGWNKVNGGAYRIAVSASGVPWVVTRNGDIFYRSGTSWKSAGGCAKDIGAGSDNGIWIIGCEPSANGLGNEIFYWNNPGWNKFSGGAIRIAVEPTGHPWVITSNSTNNIFERNGSSWQGIGGCARDIGVGSDENVWVIGCKKVSDGVNYEIWRWNGQQWNKSNGGGISISVSPNGTPWVIDAENKSWYLP